MDLRRALMEEKERVEKQLRQTRDRITEEHRGQELELAWQDQHPADTGSELYELERDTGIAMNLEATLSNIDEALERLDRGEYGVCERCRRPIPLARLQAIPYAKLCVECARQVESEYTAPVEEKTVNFARIKELGHGMLPGGEVFYDPEHHGWG